MRIQTAGAPGSLNAILARQALGLAISARSEAVAGLVGETGGLGWVAAKAVLLFAVAVIGLAIGAIISRTVTAPSAADQSAPSPP